MHSHLNLARLDRRGSLNLDLSLHTTHSSEMNLQRKKSIELPPLSNSHGLPSLPQSPSKVRKTMDMVSLPTPNKAAFNAFNMKTVLPPIGKPQSVQGPTDAAKQDNELSHVGDPDEVVPPRAVQYDRRKLLSRGQQTRQILRGSEVHENQRAPPNSLQVTNTLLPIPPKSPNTLLPTPPKSPNNLLPTPPKSPNDMLISPPKSPANNFLPSPPKSPPNTMPRGRHRSGSRRIRNASKLPRDRDTELPQNAQDITDPYGGIFVNPALPSIARPRWDTIPNRSDNTDNHTPNCEEAEVCRNSQSRELVRDVKNNQGALARRHRNRLMQKDSGYSSPHSPNANPKEEQKKGPKEETLAMRHRRRLVLTDSGYGTPTSANSNTKDAKFRFDDSAVECLAAAHSHDINLGQGQRSRNQVREERGNQTRDINQNRKEIVEKTGNKVAEETSGIKWYQRIGRSLARTVQGAESRYMTRSCDDHIGGQDNGDTAFDPEFHFTEFGDYESDLEEPSLF